MPGHVEGGDGGAHVRELVDGGDDAVGRAVVQQAAGDAAVHATRQHERDLGLAVGGVLCGKLGRGADDAAVGALDDLQGDVSETGLAPVVGDVSGVGGLDDEVDGADVARGRERTSELQGPRRCHVEAVDEHHHDVMPQRVGQSGRRASARQVRSDLPVERPRGRAPT